jgi:hypothetical protein
MLLAETLLDSEPRRNGLVRRGLADAVHPDVWLFRFRP